MEFKEIIEDLYGSVFEKRLSLLKKADYVTDYREYGDVSATGYFFEIHTGQEMQLLIDKSNDRIIYQPIKKWQPIPYLLLGTVVGLEGGYFQAFGNLSEGVMVDCQETCPGDPKDKTWGRIIIPIYEYQNYSSIQRKYSFMSEDDLILVEYPLYRKEENVIYWGAAKLERKLNDPSFDKPFDEDGDY